MSRIESLSEIGIAFCEICDNYTREIECPKCGVGQCENDLSAYGCEYC